MTEEPLEQIPEVVTPQAAVPIGKRHRSRKVYSGMWGPLEIIALGFSIAAVFSVTLLYIFFIAPSARELERVRAERDHLEQERIVAKSRFGDLQDTQSRVSHLVQSVDDFEMRFLPVAAVGKTSLYQRLNGLIVGYGLKNTNGPSFAPLETIDAEQSNQSDEERGRSRFRSLFPGVYVTVTVEGPYQNVRRFVRDIETGNDFVVISSVEIEPSDSATASTENGGAALPSTGETGPLAGTAFPGNMAADQTQARQTQAPGSRGKTHGALVSLRLEMAAYFRRSSESAVPVPTADVR